MASTALAYFVYFVGVLCLYFVAFLLRQQLILGPFFTLAKVFVLSSD